MSKYKSIVYLGYNTNIPVIDDLDRVLDSTDLLLCNKPLVDIEIKITNLLKDGYTYTDISDILGYSRAYIYKVIKGVRAKVKRG
jgi:uncharacterized protein YerC